MCYCRLTQTASRLRAETFALCLAARHPKTPWVARIIVAAVVAYAFSPIDLIPDFIPVLGYLDDLILLPLGIALAIRLIPDPVLRECRERAREAFKAGKPVSRTAAMVVIAVWAVCAVLVFLWIRGAAGER